MWESSKQTYLYQLITYPAIVRSINNYYSFRKLPSNMDCQTGFREDR